MNKHSEQRRIFDALHGFIALSPLEEALIATIPFQRLRHIRQLGTAFFVYPGAVHSRFEHSLGVMHVASRIFDSIVEKDPSIVARENLPYHRQIVRLAALCHDLGHLPFSHVAEKMILGSGGHEEKTIAIISSAYLAPILEELFALYPDEQPKADLIKVAVGAKKLAALAPSTPPFSSWQRIMAEIITGDFFGADRIDYLLRDARCTGAPYGLFDYEQLILAIRILPGKNGQLELGIEENGLEACESLLLARHFMHKRVYKHPTVKAFSYHLARFMAAFFKDSTELNSVENYMRWSDSEILTEMRLAEREVNHPLHTLTLPFSSRASRHRSIEIKGELSEKIVREISVHLRIPQEEIYAEFVSADAECHTLNFPMLRRDGQVASASGYSGITVRSDTYCTLYLPPSQLEIFRAELSKIPSLFY